MGIYLEKSKDTEGWWATQRKEGIAIEFYWGLTREDAISKAVNDKRYSDDDKQEIK